MEDKSKEPFRLSESYTFYFRVLEQKYSKDMKPDEYENQVKKLADFSTIEEFWEIFQHIRKPDSCRTGIELHLFKSNIKPMWEDPYNKQGGKISVKLKKGYSTIIWEEMILALIGNILPNPLHDIVNGLVISIKKETNVLQVWFRDYSPNKSNDLEQAIRELLQVPNDVELESKQFFKIASHQPSIAKGKYKS